MSRVPTRRIAVCAAALAGGLAAATPATAASAPSARLSGSGSSAAATGYAAGFLATVKTSSDTAIDQRLASLSDWTAQVGSAVHLSDADRSALRSRLSAAMSGLTSLRSSIDAGTDPVAAFTAYRTIFTGYRVYALLDPQVAYTRAADAELDVTGSLRDAAGIAKSVLSAAGGGTAAEQAVLADLDAQIAAIPSDTSGVVSTVLAMTPASVPNPLDPPAALISAGARLLAGRAAVTKAVSDLAMLRADLHAGTTSG
jgi:hypothetical protein